MRTVAATLVGLAALSTAAAAQAFSGTYVTENDQGAPVTLSLQQDASGQVSGTLLGNGVTFNLMGRLEQGAAVGTVNGPAGQLYFHAQLNGETMVLSLVGVGPNGEPDQNNVTPLYFQRQGGYAQQGQAGQIGRMAQAGAAAAADPLVGTFSNGTLTLTLQGGNGQYTGTAQIQGQSFPVQAQGAGTQLQGVYQAQGMAYQWTAMVQGNVMQLQVDGTTVQLQRGGAGQPAVQPGMGNGGSGQAGMAQGPQQLSPQAMEWHQWFAGKRLTRMESYSSFDATGGGGGYSNKEEWDLCSNGQFAYYGSNSLSVDAGGGGSYGVSGYGGGNNSGSGTWRIIEQSGLIGVELRWNGGQVSQHRLEYRDNKTFVDGIRIFVTQDNTTCP